MLKNKHLKDWARIVSYHFLGLSLPEVAGLATWSFGMVMTGSSSVTKISQFISRLNQEKTNTVRQRLKEWYLQAEAKTGKKRNQLEVNKCFAPLLQWILSLWNSEEKSLPLAIDATNIGQNFTVLSIHVLYQGCGIPVAWKIVKGTEKAAWKPHWQELLQCLKDVVSPDWQVLVSADRGLYSDWLFEAICALNWHPLLRINPQGTYQIRGEQEWQLLDTLIPHTGLSWSGVVTCFKTNPLPCTLLARWDDGYQEPWLIITDLLPQQGDALWYSFRAWIECSYRDIKSDGWQWHKTRLREPSRAERLWLAMAVATLWTLGVGTDVDSPPPPLHDQQTDVDSPPPNIDAQQVPLTPLAIKQNIPRQTVPQISCFLQGLINILADLLNGKVISLTGLFPQKYPRRYAVNTS
jgi:hypothetical protein